MAGSCRRDGGNSLQRAPWQVAADRGRAGRVRRSAGPDAGPPRRGWVAPAVPGGWTRVGSASPGRPPAGRHRPCPARVPRGLRRRVAVSGSRDSAVSSQCGPSTTTATCPTRADVRCPTRPRPPACAASCCSSMASWSTTNSPPRPCACSTPDRGRQGRRHVAGPRGRALAVPAPAPRHPPDLGLLRAHLHGPRRGWLAFAAVAMGTPLTVLVAPAQPWPTGSWPRTPSRRSWPSAPVARPP